MPENLPNCVNCHSPIEAHVWSHYSASNLCPVGGGEYNPGEVTP